MGAKQSKRSVDISGKEGDGAPAGEVAAAGAGGEGRMEPLADADALKPQQINGDAHIHDESTAKEEQLEIGTPENEKDATTEKESKEQEKEKEASPVTNGDPEPKENGESTPAPEDGKKPKKEKVKKKFSLRSISFSRKDKPKQDKKEKKEEPKANGEPEKVPEEATDVTTPETVKENVEEAKSEVEIKDEKTPETPVTEPLTNGTSTPETPEVESPVVVAPAPAPADVPATVEAPVPAAVPVPAPVPEEPKPEVKAEPEPEQLPVNGLSLDEPKSEASQISHTEESKPAEPIESAEPAPVPEIPVKVCVVPLSVETPPPPLPANPPPSAVASFAVTTMALDVDASLLNTAETPSTTALATSGDVVEPQTLTLESNNEKAHPISILKVLNEADVKESFIQEVICESASIPSQIPNPSETEVIREPQIQSDIKVKQLQDKNDNENVEEPQVKIKSENIKGPEVKTELEIITDLQIQSDAIIVQEPKVQIDVDLSEEPQILSESEIITQPDAEASEKHTQPGLETESNIKEPQMISVTEIITAPQVQTNDPEITIEQSEIAVEPHLQSKIEIISQPELQSEPAIIQKSEVKLVPEIIKLPQDQTELESDKKEVPTKSTIVDETNPIKEAIATEEHPMAPESSEVSLLSESINTGHIIDTHELPNDFESIQKNEFVMQKPVIVNNVVSTVTVENISKPITSTQEPIEDCKQICEEPIVADHREQIENESRSGDVTGQSGKSKVAESFSAELEQAIEQLEIKTEDKHIENMTECILDKVADEGANVTNEGVNRKGESLLLEIIPPAEPAETNELEIKVPEVQSVTDFYSLPEDLTPPPPEPCDIPLPEPATESLEESIEDLPPPPPPEDILPELIKIETKSVSSLKDGVLNESTNMVLELSDSVLVQNAMNGNGVIEKDGIDKLNDLSSSDCNGGELVAPSAAPAQLYQDALPVSDKIADLIPEVPSVPELNTETETSTDLEVAN